MVIVCADETKDYDNIIPSKAANTILDMAGIEAVFVLTKYQRLCGNFCEKSQQSQCSTDYGRNGRRRSL